MEDKKYYMTEEGFNELLIQKKDLDKKLMKLKEEKKEFSLSPSSTNEDYLLLEEEIQQLLEVISKKTDIINKAIIKNPPLSNEIVSFGKKVSLEVLDTGEIRKYQIVGTFETNVEKQKISNLCPMGKLLLGKIKKEEFYLNDFDYKILDIE